MKISLVPRVLLCCCILLSGSWPALAMPAAAYGVYADNLAAGWENWSWATVNLAAAAPVHSGSHSIGVTFDAWKGLSLHNATTNTFGATYLRFFVHGGGAGGQKMNLYLNLVVNGQPANGPAFAVPAPAANAWEDVEALLSTLNPAGAPVTGITWQDATGSSQPTIYIDDISFTSLDSPDAPQLMDGSLFPRAVPADGTTLLLVKVKVTDPQGAQDIVSVVLDASGLGSGVVSLRDDGFQNDGAAGDGVFGAALTIAPGTPLGEQEPGITAQDKEGNTASLALGVLTVLGQPGGAAPASLPQRIGWGTNAWSDTPGQDWQVNSGVPWDYVYQYITYGWDLGGWGPDFVYRFVHHAWDNHFIPLVTVYDMLATPPASGEGGIYYAAKLQNASTVEDYLDSLRTAAQQAKGSAPVIFVIEPDFFGYMQQLSNAPNPPAGVKPNDPSSYPVALNISGYPNSLVGFGHYIVDMIHTEAPNALVAPEASFWAMNNSLWSLTNAEAVQNAQDSASFLVAAMGESIDLLVVEWSDMDSGNNPATHPFWDNTDQVEPRPTRAILWENALSRQAGKRLILWQVPVGNMSLDNSNFHYQDNHAAYIFSHPRDLFDAGVMGVVFGGGQKYSTQVDTDGGAVQAQGAVAYAAPAAPTGLAADQVSGSLVSLTWNENSEQDLWGYRLVYQKISGGAVYRLDVQRRNSADLLLPVTGSWKIALEAYDAMGNTSALSAQVTVDITGNTKQVFLPLIKWQ